MWGFSAAATAADAATAATAATAGKRTCGVSVRLLLPLMQLLLLLLLLLLQQAIVRFVCYGCHLSFFTLLMNCYSFQITGWTAQLPCYFHCYYATATNKSE